MNSPEAISGGVARIAESHDRDDSKPRLALMLVDQQGWVRLRTGADVLALVVAAVVAVTASGRGDTLPSGAIAAAFAITVLTVLGLRRDPSDRLNASTLTTFGYVLGVCSLGGMLTIALGSIVNIAHPVGLGFWLWATAVICVGVSRILLLLIRRRSLSHDSAATPTLIVGAGLVGAHLVHRLTTESYGLRPVGYLDANPLPRQPSNQPQLPVLGTPDDLNEAIRQTGARHVILSFSSGPDHSLVAIVRRCQELHIGVSLVPRLYESINERSTLDHVGGLPLLTLHTVDPKGWQFAVKHAIDRSFAFVALLLLAVPLALIAVAVKLSSPGPALFQQRRVGRDGREFGVLKFRTMRVGPAAPTEFELPDGVAPGGVEGSDRRTWLGRWMRDLSVDELPQLINVLRGDMSLVGPRPERPDYVMQFARDVARYEDRHRVRSGITGWAQVHGLRGQTSIADRVEWDNYYIQNWSLTLDFRIMLMTVAEMLRQRDSATAKRAAKAESSRT